MFPFDMDEDEMDVKEETHKEPIDYEIDFETGKLTGRVITGVDAIIQWIKIVLSTDRYFFPQYSWNHGSDLHTLIGQNYDEEYVQTEVKRMLNEALLVDESITGIDNLEFEMKDSKLTISFTVNTIYGRGEVNV